MEHERAMLVLDGPLDAQVEEAVRELTRRGALTARPGPAACRRRVTAGPRTGVRPASSPSSPSPAVTAVTEELLGAAARLGARRARRCTRCARARSTRRRWAPPAPTSSSRSTAPRSAVAEDVADALAAYVRETAPWAVLAPSTAFGREVAGRAAAATGSGLVGDAIALSARDGLLVAAKPAFAGALVADITCRSATQMVTVRPGVLPSPAPRPRATSPCGRGPAGARGRVRVLSDRRNDDVETLARAEVVIGVGTGVTPEEYEELSPLAALLGAELAATRKVTDQGLGAPRPPGRHHGPLHRPAALRRRRPQREVQPHGRGAGGGDHPGRQRRPGRPGLRSTATSGIVGDWHEVVPLLHGALRRARRPSAADATVS